MRGTRSLSLALVAAALGAAPALAQQQNATTAPPVNAPAAVAPAPNATTTTTNDLSGSLQKYNDEWRTSKLVGATVYDNNGDSIGTVNDLLMGDDGRITQAVISTGGVLGMGGKLVAVPFDQLKFEPSANNREAPRQMANTPAATNTPADANTHPGTYTPAARPAPASTSADQGTSRPTYYSLVLPGATKASLDKQEAFKFASTD